MLFATLFSTFAAEWPRNTSAAIAMMAMSASSNAYSTRLAPPSSTKRRLSQLPTLLRRLSVWSSCESPLFDLENLRTKAESNQEGEAGQFISVPLTAPNGLPARGRPFEGFDVVHGVAHEIGEFDPNSEVVVRSVDDVAYVAR